MEVPQSILVVDDDRRIRDSLAKILQKEGYEVETVEGGVSALERLRARSFDLVLTDAKMPRMSGLDLIRLIQGEHPDVSIILMTAYGTMETAMQAMKEGATDYIEKPLKRAEVVAVVHRTLETRGETVTSSQSPGFSALGRLVGKSKPMRRLLDQLEQVASSAATVLIQGESGTGKELVAQAIHHLSPRRDRPLVKVSCAALPETLLEAELFGYEKGAFTGASTRKRGRFELADGGTLFLDEVADMPLPVQVKLLRVLQDGTFERLGGTQTQAVDVRILAATHRDLADEVKAGRFREDLYYRLNVIALKVPPLRDRMEDVPLLVGHFLRWYNEKNGKQVQGFSDQAFDALLHHRWPGNVRELENAIERAVVMAKTDVIRLEDLPPELQAYADQDGANITVPLGTTLEAIERQVILETLRRTKGNKEVAAKLLGISTRTIYRKLDVNRYPQK